MNPTHLTGIELLSPGTLTLLQDAGRFGMAALGITQGGPMDGHSFAWANALVGNPRNSTVLEHHIGGLILRAQQPCTLAVTGAEVPLQQNGQDIPCWQPFTLQPGDELSVGYASRGLRIYIAVAGGFAIAQQFGSSATVMREGLGGLEQNGQKLAAGAVLPIGTPNLQQALAPPTAAIRHLTLGPTADSESLTLRVLPGYQVAAFTASAQAQFYLQPYQISPQGDRMGIKLSGTAIPCQQRQLLSEGISLGAIQIPPDGQPIVLLQDRQTLGGYPKIGNVLSLDCWALAQARPGSLVQFQPIDCYQSHNALALYQASFAPRSL